MPGRWTVSPVAEQTAVVETPELRARAVAGDQAALAELYQHHQPTILRYLMRRTGGDRHLAEDLASQTWERALRRLGSWGEQGRPLLAWLITIAGNLLADHYKSGWRRHQVPCGDFVGEADDTAPRMMWAVDPGDPATAVADGDFQSRARVALALALMDLTDWQRIVVRLRFADGMSVRDTATTLGVEEGSVKAATYRAMRTLARHPLTAELRAELRDGGGA